MHETMLNYLRAMELEGRGTTASSTRLCLDRYQRYLDEVGVEPLSATVETIIGLREWLFESYRKPDGRPLAKGTVATWLSAVKGYYGWLYRRGDVGHDPSAKVKLPKIRRSKVAADPLSVQEATALVQTQARIASTAKPNSTSWAIEHRSLAMICMALATGRRCSSLMDLRVRDLDFEELEVRVEWEKGHAGRVLPCAKWALAVAKEHIETARPRLLAINRRADPGWLFVGVRTAKVCKEYLTRLVQHLQPIVAEENEDLEDLPAKRLTSHSLRVTFATSMMFLNGADIRVVNDLLLHKQLSTTAQYTPLELDDLRRAMRAAHPRA